ncbi:sodium:proton antiporter NhaD [Carboxylicivirga sediminis]|uniref:Sodium:proton antiporter NhaD n=2 Tax=Carboxylicivirga sediminis TaxID=2006564 RepID=A0A941F4V5_9BACT|nr:sodium:proton antiporter NhaD [Carboxylicivirga sediminis]
MFLLMVVVFVVGYGFIVFEHVNHINKAATALCIGTLLWAIYALGGEGILSNGASASWLQFSKTHARDVTYFITHHELFHHLSEISSILFFLVGAMTIVELVDKYQGFRVITSKIESGNIKRLLWIISLLTFFMSAVLDNLTTTIVLITVLRKLLTKQENRWVFASVVVISANAGGAWSPIGDVTTIMLWIGGQITAAHIIGSLIVPSVVNMLVSTVLFSLFTVKGQSIKPVLPDDETREFTTHQERVFMLVVGTLALISVPVFKTITHLPPYLGMLLGLSVLWIMTDRYLKKRSAADKRTLTVTAALKAVDIPTVLFFLGVLSAVAALQSAGHLDVLSQWLDNKVHNIYAINLLIGVISSIVDNVPLVAASMGMYSIEAADAVGMAGNFVQNGVFWTFLTYCAGTGGSLLIIGSASGVAAMGLEKINFLWYLKRISWIALVGYLAGAVAYYIQVQLF